jgi:hypothetical protein
MTQNIYLHVQRLLARYVFDDPSVTFLGIMLHPGPAKTTYLDIYSDRPCWRALLDAPPPFMGIVTEVHVCDSERAVQWLNGKEPRSTPREATHKDETLVHVEMPFANYDLYDELLKDSEKFLIPQNIVTAKVFGNPISYRRPTCVRPIRLDGQVIEVETVEPIKHSDGTVEAPALFERGIPIQPIALPFHVNLLAVLSGPVPEALVDDLMSHLG